MRAGTFAAVHIIGSLALTTAFTIIAVYPSVVLVQAPFIVFTVYSLVFLLVSPAHFGKKNFPLACKLITAGAFSTTTISILLLYIFNFSSNFYWNTNVNAGFIVDYALQAYQLRETLPLPLWVMVSTLALLLVLVFRFYFKNTGILFRAFRVFWDSSLSAENVSKLEKLVSIAPLTFLVLATVVFANRPSEAAAFEGAWFGEPITDLFAASNSIDMKHVAGSAASDSSYNAIDRVSHSKAAKPGSPNVILLVVDALRADHVGAYGYDRRTTPFIDSLISDGKALKVDNGFSTCSESICSIVSILSARYRNEFAHSNINLNGVLKANGYEVQFILSADHSWSGLNTYYPPYDYYFDGKSNTRSKQYDLTDDRAVIDELRGIKDHEAPTFLYLHLMSAHLSSARKGEFIKFRPYENSSNWYYKLPFVNGGDISSRQLKINRYDNGVVEADYRVKEVFSILSSKGYLDNAIVWIVSDHGEAFSEHGHFGHGKSLYQEELSIPMVVVDSDLDFYRNTAAVTQVDIAPTIVDRLGFDVPKEWNGRSLNKLDDGERITWHEIPNRKATEAALISKPGEYIYKATFNRKPFLNIEQVFELYSDKNEIDNLVNTAQGRAVAERLRKKIQDSS